ncbi:MAG TPA: endo-1,4-beta-xylanase [Verrucomicrobiae bacterium]|nr:endo-1,4-beta-xylanase [Verrucomicrobiae bacterium]
MSHKRSTAAAAVLMAALAAGSRAQTAPAPLKDAFQKAFRIGTAVNQAQFEERDTRGVPIIKAQFNTISPENVLKWESVHPRPDGYNFAAADRYVEFGERNHMFVIGHTLVWHSQTPRWVFQNDNGEPADRATLLQRMRDHIHTVVGRYKGRIGGWDVVNEALNDDGTLRQSPWLKIIGEDFIVQAFQFAHEADPAAELYYNDYSLENPAKRKGAVELIRKLKAAGVPITAIGSQEHNALERPTAADVDATITELAATGVKVNVTELDIDVLPRVTRQTGADVNMKGDARAGSNPYADGLPDAVQQALAKRYAELFSVFWKHRDVMTRITFWGVTDGDSWLNNWPVPGRSSYPLLFDRSGGKKPAFNAVIGVAGQ